MAITAAMALVYVGVLRVLEPGINDRVLLLGVFLIGIGGAVVMNASLWSQPTAPRQQQPLNPPLRPAGSSSSH